MMNIIRADLFRIFRGKAVYISFSIVVLLVLLTVFVFRVAPQTGVQVSTLDSEYSESIESFEDFVLGGDRVITGADAAGMGLSSMDIMVFFFLPIISVVALAMFSTGAIKNELSNGLNRIKLYFSKLILSFVLSVIFMIAYLFMMILFASIFEGFGYWGDGLMLDVALSFAGLTLVTLAFCSVGIFMSFVFQRSGAVIGIYIALVFAPGMIIMLLAIAFPDVMDLLNFDLFTQYQFFSDIRSLEASELIRGIAVCLSFILVPTIAGISIFKRSEIK